MRSKLSFIPEISLKRGRDHRLRAGHLWVYRGEIEAWPEKAEPGGIVDVKNASGRFLGRGYFNPHSQICIRLLTREREAIDRDFFAMRLDEAFAHRRRFYPDAGALRLVFSESDLLPGLIVDKYEDCLVVQVLTLGMEVRRQIILDLLVDRLAPQAVQERSDSGARRHEGLGSCTGSCYGEVPDGIIVNDGGLSFWVDLCGGQKTGHFLDQRENRKAAAVYAGGRSVLDCFCHTGMFGIAAARGGATSVVGVDTDASALALADRNAALNGVGDRCRFVEANAFDFLRESVEKGRRYGMLVLDPPSFTKSKLRIDQALRGYKEINLRAVNLLEPGGILVTCSCSYHISRDDFQEVVLAAAADAGKQMRLLERRGQPPDHPVLLGVPETEYLKCLILEAMP